MEALEQRAALLPEGARRRLAARLDGAADVAGAAAQVAPASPPPAALPGGAGLLSALLAARRDNAPAAGDGPAPASYPELSQLDFFRETWSRLGTVRELRQSRAKVPENAGPLNSSHLMHQSLALMRELSPGYLHQFLAYVDALSWMEQLQQASLGVSLGKTPARRGGRAARAKP